MGYSVDNTTQRPDTNCLNFFLPRAGISLLIYYHPFSEMIILRRNFAVLSRQYPDNDLQTSEKCLKMFLCFCREKVVSSLTDAEYGRNEDGIYFIFFPIEFHITANNALIPKDVLNNCNSF